MPSVVCIVLNWNGWRDTQNCLSALQKCDYGALTVFVVDNGSTDDSVEMLQKSHPWVQILQSGANLGFSGGCNVGIRTALHQRADYIWLLNNDTIPAPDALRALLSLAEADRNSGAIGSVMSYMDNPTQVQAWGGGRVNIWTGRTFHATRPHRDDWFDYLTAASILLRSSAIQQIGLLDENFFLYWEDTDYSYRLRASGWTLRVAQNATVLHKEHASTDRNTRVLQRHTIESGFRFLRKHSPLPALSLCIFLIRKLIRVSITGDFSRMPEIFQALRTSGFSRDTRAPLIT